MARLRKFIAYRRLERPYSRISKYKEQSFVKSSPHISVVKFEMGDPNKKFDCELKLVSKNSIQVRHNALESARISCNRLLEKVLGKGNFFFKMLKYPFHVLRENPLAAGAGADRYSKGMKLSFGKPVSKAVQIKKGEALIMLRVNKQHLKTAKLALKRAAHKLPLTWSISVA